MLKQVLQMIMGFPTDSDAGQALNAAGEISVKLRKFFPFHLSLCQRDVIFRVSDNNWYNISKNYDWDEYCVSPTAFLVGSAPTPATMATPAPTSISHYPP